MILIKEVYSEMIIASRAKIFSLPLLFSRPVFSASLRLRPLASAYKPKPRLRSRPAPSARSLASLSLNQRLVCEPLSCRAIYEAVEPRQGVVLDVPFVEPERKFVNVAVKMLGAGVMIDANQPTLQDGKNAFDAVGCRLTPNVFASRD
jgi:hypothetical protein